MPTLRLGVSPAAQAQDVACRFDAPRTRQAASPARKPPPALDAEAVVARLEDAGRTLLRLQQSGPEAAAGRTRHRHLLHALGGYAGQPPPRPEPPSPARLRRMDQAIAWIALIPSDPPALRRIVGCRCLVSPSTGRHLFGWHQLARVLGAEALAVRRWHAAGIAAIVAALQQEAAVAGCWDRVQEPRYCRSSVTLARQRGVA